MRDERTQFERMRLLRRTRRMLAVLVAVGGLLTLSLGTALAHTAVSSAGRHVGWAAHDWSSKVALLEANDPDEDDAADTAGEVDTPDEDAQGEDASEDAADEDDQGEDDQADTNDSNGGQDEADDSGDSGDGEHDGADSGDGEHDGDSGDSEDGGDSGDD